MSDNLNAARANPECSVITLFLGLLNAHQHAVHCHVSELQLYQEPLTHLPQFGSECPGWHIKGQHEPEPPEEGLVDVVNEVRSEDDDAGEPLNVVEEHTHVHIGVAVRGGAGGRWWDRVM